MPASAAKSGRARNLGEYHMFRPSSIREVTLRVRVDWMMHVMKTNYAGAIGVTNSFLPHMRSRRAGTVVLIGSRSAYRNEFLVSHSPCCLREISD